MEVDSATKSDAIIIKINCTQTQWHQSQRTKKMRCLSLIFLLIAPNCFAETYIIGGSAPITGPLASIVAPILKGGEDYINYANATNVLGKGNQIKLIQKDDQFKPKLFRNNVEDLIDNKVLILQGGTPASIKLVMPDLIEENLPHLYVVGDLEYVNTPVSKQLMVSYQEQISANLEYIQKHHKNKEPIKVAVMYLGQGSASKDFLGTFDTIAKKLGQIEIVKKYSHTGTEVDFTSTIKAIKKHKVNYIFLMTIEYVASVIAKNIHSLGYLSKTFGEAGKISISTGNFGAGLTYLSLTASIPHEYLFTSSLNFTSDISKKVMTHNKREAQYAKNAAYHAGILQGQVTVEAIKQTKARFGTVNRKNILKTLKEFKFNSTASVSPIMFTKKTGGMPNQKVQIYKLSNKNYIKQGEPFIPISLNPTLDKYFK